MKFITILALTVLSSSAVLGATAIAYHVIDVEYVSLADRYALDPNKGGRDFYDWVNEQDRKDYERDRWVRDFVDDVAFEVAASFDPRLGDRD